MKHRIVGYDFYPGAVEMLARLRKKFCLVIITNGPLFSQEPKVFHLNLEQHVDHVIVAGYLRHQKPHPSIFELACEKAACLASEAIHVGDSLGSDIAGAHGAGITSVWVEPNPGERTPDPLPDFHIRCIQELEELLEKEIST